MQPTAIVDVTECQSTGRRSTCRRHLTGCQIVHRAKCESVHLELDAPRIGVPVKASASVKRSERRSPAVDRARLHLKHTVASRTDEPQGRSALCCCRQALKCLANGRWNWTANIMQLTLTGKSRGRDARRLRSRSDVGVQLCAEIAYVGGRCRCDLRGRQLTKSPQRGSREQFGLVRIKAQTKTVPLSEVKQVGGVKQ
jgi:hypothetical protein